MALRVPSSWAPIIHEELARNLETYEEYMKAGDFPDLDTYMEFSADVEELREIVADFAQYLDNAPVRT
jgi:hypothetical protein